MAEPIGDSAGLDSRLRDALGQAAEQGDSTGVADAIRSRIAAGDPGTSVASSTAPGWGGGGVGSWLPWIGLIVVAAMGGTAVGASGLVGAPVGAPGSGPTAVVVGTAPAASCPGGPIIDEFHAGDRVLAVQRSEESDYFGVRDPRDLSTVLWLPASVLTMDAGQPDPSTLPVGKCPEIVLSYPTPAPTPTPTPEETQAPQPADATPPAVLQYWVTPDAFVYHDGTDNSAVMHVLASDNIGVAGVNVSWTGVHSGTGQMSWTGSEWQFNYVVPVGTSFGDITFTLRARDSAGNLSSPVTLKVRNDSVPI